MKRWLGEFNWSDQLNWFGNQQTHRVTMTTLPLLLPSSCVFATEIGRRRRQQREKEIIAISFSMMEHEWNFIIHKAITKCWFSFLISLQLLMTNVFQLELAKEIDEFPFKSFVSFVGRRWVYEERKVLLFCSLCFQLSTSSWDAINFTAQNN